MQMLIKHIKPFLLNTLNKRLWCLLFISTFCFININCGKRKPPLPPVEKVVQRVQINGTQVGNQIRVQWQMPARNASDNSTLNIDRVDIYRLAEQIDAPLGLTEEEFASRSTLIATVPIKESDFDLKEKTFIDKLQFAGQAARLRYAIRFVNKAGQKAAFSNFLIIEPSSRIASNPTSLTASVSQEQISLNWQAPATNVDGSQTVNILGYNLYRSSSDELTKRLNDSPLKKTEFTDTFFAFEKTYLYFVRTVSIGKNGEQVESLSSEIVEIKPIDTFAPSAPDSITIAAAPNNISIFFAVNPEKDVVGYKVFRTIAPDRPKEDWTLLTKELLKTNTFQDTKIESGIKYFYYLKAYDIYGNESQPSVVVSENAF
jgi:hypothetical protein